MKRTLLIFGVVGSLFFASCGDGNDETYGETETYEQRYDTEDEGIAYDDGTNGLYEDGTIGTTGGIYDNTTVGTGTTPGTMGVSQGLTSDNRYICTDSTLVTGL